MKKPLILLAFLTLVACSNKQVMLGKKCLKEVNGKETTIAAVQVYFLAISETATIIIALINVLRIMYIFTHISTSCYINTKSTN